MLLVGSLLLFTLGDRTVSAAAGCLYGRQGDNCPLSCHCKDDADCDGQTGQCPDGCAAGMPPGYPWQGPGCQIGECDVAAPESNQMKSGNHI